MLKITTLQFLYHQHSVFDKMFSAVFFCIRKEINNNIGSK